MRGDCIDGIDCKRISTAQRGGAEAYAASIATTRILQNLAVEPELDADGVRRRQIKKAEPIRCIIDTANDLHEISLDENVIREDMHPADQFEACKTFSEERALGAEDIAAHLG